MCGCFKVRVRTRIGVSIRVRARIGVWVRVRARIGGGSIRVRANINPIS